MARAVDNLKKKYDKLHHDIFFRYLELNNLRTTPERFRLLNYIYRRKTYSTINDMATAFSEKTNPNSAISRTLDLLLDANLVAEVQLGLFNNQRAFVPTGGHTGDFELIVCECMRTIFVPAPTIINHASDKIMEENNLRTKRAIVYRKVTCLNGESCPFKNLNKLTQ